jgi:uncharacterized protein (DUF433 family)
MEDAARYLHVPYQTLRHWVQGGLCDPVIKISQKSPPVLSFMDLSECWVLASLRHREGIPMRNIRSAIETLRERYNCSHPLVDQEFETDGIHLFVRDAIGLVNLSRRDQRALEGIMKAYLRRIDRDVQGLARTLYPFTRKEYLTAAMDAPKVVMIDAYVAFGRPVLAGTGISTAFLASRHKGGDSIAALAREYQRQVREIEEAIRWEGAESAA